MCLLQLHTLPGSVMSRMTQRNAKESCRQINIWCPSFHVTSLAWEVNGVLPGPCQKMMLGTALHQASHKERDVLGREWPQALEMGDMSKQLGTLPGSDALLIHLYLLG